MFFATEEDVELSHILIVDDEPLIRRGLVAMLQQYSQPFASIRTAENGIEALKNIEQSLPQIMLTDIRMPKMDGLELCKQVSRKFPHILIIVISGYSDFEYAQSAMSYGVKEYLLKPVATNKIHALLNRLALPQHASISLARYDELIERLVAVIWRLDVNGTLTCLEEWQLYFSQAVANDHDYFRLLNEVLLMLKRRLALLNFHVKHEKVPSSSNIEGGFLYFHAEIMRIIDELTLQRGGLDLMKKAKDYIDAHIMKELSLEDVAAYTGFTSPYFSHLFKKTNHQTFVQYRIMKRMEIAKTLLEEPHYRTADIAHKVGYDNYPHFSKTFKKAIGYSPQKYRQMMGIK
jgi:two-component system response regulator YesN